MRDVWISGLGMITPAGADAETTFARLLAGGRFVRSVAELAEAGCRTTTAAPVRGFDESSAAGYADRAGRLAVAAAAQAIRDAGLSPPERAGPRRGVDFGASKPAMHRFCDIHRRWLAGDREAAAGLVAALSPAAPADAVAAELGIGGPRRSLPTACATGTASIVRAAQLIADDRLDVVVAGSTESAIHPLVVGAFDRLGVLGRSAAEPAATCRPFDADRSGFAVGEGAAAVVLQSARPARPWGRVLGWAGGADPTGAILLDDTGRTLAAVQQRALQRAGVRPADVAYYAAHGTGTVINDRLETRAFIHGFGSGPRRPAAASCKGAIGHLLGAAGSVQFGVALMALRAGRAPPTANLCRRAPDCAGMPVCGKPQALGGRVGLACSMGFGGQIACVVLEAL